MKGLRPKFFKGLFRPRLFGVSAAFVATFLLTVFGLVHPAMAQSMSSFGDVICNAAVNIVPYLDVFNMAAYVIGAVLIVQGVLHLKNHYDNPGQNPHHRTVAMLVAGALLSLLPTVAATLTDTLFGMGGGPGENLGGLSACVVTEGGAGGTAGTVGLDVMLENFVANIKDPLIFVTSAVSILLGVFLIIRGLMKASKYGTDPRTASPTHIITGLVIGALLVAIGQNVDMILGSLFGTDTIQKYTSLSWTGLQGLDNTDAFVKAVGAALTFVQVIGFIAFVRGWNIIRHAIEGTGQATVPQGVTHIIGGVLAININQFLQIMDTTFGTGFFSS